MPKVESSQGSPGAQLPRLTRLQVKNYRSLEAVDVPLSPLSAFVGPNGTGKTTILRAIDVVLGDVWPSLRSFRIPHDFTGFDASKEIEIVVSFAPPYAHRDTVSKNHSVGAIRVSCRPYRKSGRWGEAGDLHVDVDPLNEKGEVPSVALGAATRGQKLPFGPLRVGTELRDHARLLFIDHRRSLAQHLPSVRGSILGRLLQPARREFTKQADFKLAYEAAMAFLRTEQVKSVEEAVADTAKRMLGFLGSRVAQSIEIGFGFADPANPFSSLRLQYRESGLTVPGEELGLGIQSAMVVGIFEAFRQLGGDFGTVVIEEPEMYLHPQAQRYFCRLLHDMTEKGQCQVIYSTHSPIFADVNRFESVRVVRREAGTSTTVASVRQERHPELVKARSALKLGGRFDTARNEVLFARRALLVEGFGDRVAALLVAEKLGLDVDAEALAIVDCGGKAGIELIGGVCRALDIPVLVLHDDDIWPTDLIGDPENRRRVEEENKTARQANARIKDAFGTPAGVFTIAPTLEQVLGIGRDAKDKPRRVAEALRGVDLENVLPDLQPLIEAVKALKEERR